jgi:hypothetical protein
VFLEKNFKACKTVAQERDIARGYLQKLTFRAADDSARQWSCVGDEGETTAIPKRSAKFQIDLLGEVPCCTRRKFESADLLPLLDGIGDSPRSKGLTRA